MNSSHSINHKTLFGHRDFGRRTSVQSDHILLLTKHLFIYSDSLSSMSLSTTHFPFLPYFFFFFSFSLSLSFISHQTSTRRLIKDKLADCPNNHLIRNTRLRFLVFFFVTLQLLFALDRNRFVRKIFSFQSIALLDINKNLSKTKTHPVFQIVFFKSIFTNPSSVVTYKGVMADPIFDQYAMHLHFKAEFSQNHDPQTEYVIAKSNLQLYKLASSTGTPDQKVTLSLYANNRSPFDVRKGKKQNNNNNNTIICVWR